MLSSGNGNPMQCVANLVRIVRGECVYDRVKGINPEFEDQPEEVVAPLLVSDAKWLIETYEPRVSVSDINVGNILAKEGDFSLNIKARLEGM